MEKKLRIFDLSAVDAVSAPQPNGAPVTNGGNGRALVNADSGFEVGVGVHKGTIKAIVWTRDPNVLVTAIYANGLASTKILSGEDADGEVVDTQYRAPLLVLEYLQRTDGPPPLHG